MSLFKDKRRCLPVVQVADMVQPTVMADSDVDLHYIIIIIIGFHATTRLKTLCDMSRTAK